MAQDGEFKHISVTPEEEEDVVIQAGATEAPAQPERGFATVREPERPAGEPAAQQPAAAESRAVEDPRPARAAQPAAERASAPAAKEDDYHETTLDDIHSTSMSKMQIGVLVGAVIIIVIGVVYYFAFV